jgi:glucokinase
MQKVIGIDVGGTFIKAAAVAASGDIIAKEEWPTRVEQGTDAVIDRIASIANEVAVQAGWSWQQVSGVGIGLPAFIDFDKGIVEEAINLGWKDVAIKRELEQRLGIQVEFDNDANAAALGEAWVGGGRGRKHVLAVTLGTGVGGGVIINGQIYRGANGMAGEVGHIIIQEENGDKCNCGHYGCLETISSATAILRAAKRRIVDGETTTLQTVENLSTQDVFEHAEQGDRVAAEVVDYAVKRLGFVLAMMANTLNPEVIVIGGGPSQAGEILYKPLNQYFKKYALKRVAEAAEICPAELGNDAGVLGAARLILG